jgi:toxin ParE1/3/4
VAARVKIGWTEVAISHLRAACDYVAADNPTAAEEVLRRIFSAAEFLVQHPNLGRMGRVEGTRELVITGTPFIVAYRTRGGGVEILAVLHGARKWPGDF